MTDNTTKLNETIDQGERAQIVLKELDRSFKRMEQKCFDTFTKSSVDDEYGRLSCWHHMKVLEQTKSFFEREVIAGKNARLQLTKLAQQKTPLRAVKP